MKKYDGASSKLFNFFSMISTHEKKQPGSLSWKETYVLHYILHHQPVSIGAIAASLYISVVETSRMLTELKNRNFLCKCIKRNDHRFVLVSITDAGKSALEAAEWEFLECLGNPSALYETRNADADYFELHYQHSGELVCCFKPVFDADGEIADLEYLQANHAFIREFPKIETLNRYFLLSKAMYQHFSILVSVCNTVWKSHVPVKLVLDARFPAREYVCIWNRCGRNYIIVTVEPLNDTAGKYLHELLPLYRYFFETKPIKMVLECDTGKILEVNKAAVKFYGWSNTEFLKKTIYEISLNPPEVIRSILGAGENADETIFHVAHKIADGSIRNVEVHASSCLWGKTRIQYSCIISDISTGVRQSQDPGIKIKKKSVMSEGMFAAGCGNTVSGLPELFNYIEDNGTLCGYNAGDHFFEYGTLLPTFGFIVEGLFRVYYISSSGREYTLEYLRPGYFIDSLTFTDCFAKDEIVIEAVIPGRVFVIEQNRFMLRAVDDPDAFKLLYYLDKYRFTKLEQHGFSLLTRNAKERYENFMQNESDIESFLRGQDIASYLGITPETLSRIKNAN